MQTVKIDNMGSCLITTAKNKFTKTAQDPLNHRKVQNVWQKIHQPQCTLQLVCKDSVLFVGFWNIGCGLNKSVISTTFVFVDSNSSTPVTI
jgi:hypothetical protein